MNALEHVVIPRLEGTIAYIKSEMDEMEREEFFRVKKQVGGVEWLFVTHGGVSDVVFRVL